MSVEQEILIAVARADLFIICYGKFLALIIALTVTIMALSALRTRR